MTLPLFILIPCRLEFFSDSGRAISFKPDDDSTFLVGTTSLCYTLLFSRYIRVAHYSCANNQVGTDEGMVYLCTTQYSSKYLNTYPVSWTQPCAFHNILLQHLSCKKNQIITWLTCIQAHNTPVYNIQWNTFIPNIFITCASGDD